MAPLYEANLGSFDNLPHRLASSSPPQYAGGRLGGFAITIATLAVLRGPASVMPLLERIAPSLPGVIRELPDPLDRNALLPALYTLSCLNVARCCGALLPAEANGVEETWLPQLAGRANDLTEPERHTLAFAACSTGFTRLVPRFADLPGFEEPFVPGRVFGFNVPGFAGYLASAIEHSGTYQDVEPAWLDFVHRFPYKLDTRMLDFPALLLAARAVYATIGGLPESEVALELHRLVTGI
jgi:hypothetical protein